MDTNIALIASGYLLTRIGLLAALGYLVYRVLRARPSSAKQPQMTLARVGAKTRRFER